MDTLQYVCMYECIYVCILNLTLTVCLYVYVCVCVCVCVFIYLCTYLYKTQSMKTKIHILRNQSSQYIHKYIHTYIHTYVPLCELSLCSLEPLFFGRDFGLLTPDICKLLFIDEILFLKFGCSYTVVYVCMYVCMYD